MTFNELVTEILKVLPNATFGEDILGQIVIYTGKEQCDSGNEKPLSDH
jgi:hypothetical protein